MVEDTETPRCGCSKVWRYSHASLRDFTEKAAAVWPHGQDCKKQPDSMRDILVLLLLALLVVLLVLLVVFVLLLRSRYSTDY